MRMFLKWPFTDIWKSTALDIHNIFIRIFFMLIMTNKIYSIVYIVYPIVNYRKTSKVIKFNSFPQPLVV